MEVLDANLREAYEGSYYTIVGAGGSILDWVEGYQQMFDEKDIGTITKWVKFTGADMNREYQYTNMNRYPDELQFLAFPLDGLDLKKLSIFKIHMQDRWFDDIVDNNHQYNS